MASNNNKRKIQESERPEEESLNKKARTLSTSSDQDVIEYVPVKVMPVLIVIADDNDTQVSSSDQYRNCPIDTSKQSCVQHTPSAHKHQGETKVSSEEIELMRKKRPKITYFKLISDAFIESNKTWLNCAQIRKRITQKYAYYREIGEKKWTNQIYGQLAKSNLFNRKNVTNERLKLYSLKENPTFDEPVDTYVKKEK